MSMGRVEGQRCKQEEVLAWKGSKKAQKKSDYGTRVIKSNVHKPVKLFNG
jgi:hypothetical protein